MPPPTPASAPPGDIYGGRDIPDIGLSRNVIASSFGKAATCDDSVSENSSSDDDDARAPRLAC